MGKIYEFLGLTVGCIQNGMDFAERRAAYACDITYGTNNEFGFDYLRDNLAFRLEERVQRGVAFAVVDEVDSILIDEARTPLIISGPAAESTELYLRINELAPRLTRRTMPGRRWSDGLHQAVEAKEGVRVREENQTVASITFQNYFRLYKKLSGMTGTADTEAPEFMQIYGLEVVVIPTHRPMIRKDNPDFVYLTQGDKFKAIIEDIRDCVTREQPALVGTTSIETSEYLSGLLQKEGVEHQVLNAKQHEREAHIVALVLLGVQHLEIGRAHV